MGQLRDGIMKRGRSWSYVIRVPNPQTGLSKPTWVGGFATEAEAKAARDRARVAAHRGEYVTRSRLTVASYLREWLATHRVEVKPKTHEDYRRLVESYVIPHLGRTPLQSVRPATLTTLYAMLLKEGGKGGRPLSPRTVGYVHAVLRKAFNDAVVVEQMLPSNPVLRAKRPRVEVMQAQMPDRGWDASQLAEFLNAVSGERLHPFFRLAAFTGARRGELLFLHWGDVDLDNEAPHIVVRGTVSIVGGRRVDGTTKSGRVRMVGLDLGTVAVMRAWRARQEDERRFADGSWRGARRVFLTELGSQLPPDRPGEVMRRVIVEHNNRLGSPPLPRIRFHDLRHTHATLPLRAGVPVHVVAARLGHVDPAITLRVYAHVLRDQASGVAEMFAQVVEEAMTPAVGALQATEDVRAVSKPVSKPSDAVESCVVSRAENAQVRA